MKRHSLSVFACAVVGLVSIPAFSPLQAQGTSTVFVQEGFEDANVSSRGWYDTSGVPLSTAEKYAGTRSMECHFTVGATACVGGHIGRHQFQSSDSVYLAYYIKYTPNWVGSGRPYHPHMFYFLTDADTAFVGPAFTHLTTYVEAIGGEPQLAMQDGKNVDQSRIGQDLTAITEQRGVAGCNGDSDGTGISECYPAGAVYWNGKRWPAGATFFDNNPGSPRYKGNWHLVEAFFKLNSIAGGKGMKDGIVQYWYDGTPVIQLSNVVLRTAANSTMRFNQVLISPYIGDGSPADQTFWIDNVVIASARPATPPLPPSTSPVPAAPTNVHIVR